MPKSMEIQYSWDNIKEDMSNFMKNSENVFLTIFLLIIIIKDFLLICQ